MDRKRMLKNEIGICSRFWVIKCKPFPRNEWERWERKRKRESTGAGNAQKARLSKCWQIAQASLAGASMLLAPSSPFDEGLFAASGFDQATVILVSLLYSIQMPPWHLSPQVIHMKSSIAPISHPSCIWSALTLPFELGSCKDLLLQNPSSNQMSLPPLVFARSNGYIYYPPAHHRAVGKQFKSSVTQAICFYIMNL